MAVFYILSLASSLLLTGTSPFDVTLEQQIVSTNQTELSRQTWTVDCAITNPKTNCNITNNYYKKDLGVLTRNAPEEFKVVQLVDVNLESVHNIWNIDEDKSRILLKGTNYALDILEGHPDNKLLWLYINQETSNNKFTLVEVN